MRNSTILLWISLMYSNGFMWLYKGDSKVAEYHGFVIWGSIVIFTIVESIVENKK